MRGLLTDISYYQPEFNFSYFKEMGGLGVVVKASMQLGYDPKFFDFAKKVKDNGLILGIYHWVDPIPSRVDKQVDLFSEAVQKTNPDFLVGDVEQWWNDWTGYYAYIQGRISYDQVPRLSDNKISSFSREWFRRTEINFPDKKLMIYSGAWFRSRSPSISNWIGDYPYWGADYRKAPKKIMSPEEVKEWIQGIENMALFKGVKEKILHQFTSNVIIPNLNVEHGINKMVDLNLTISSEEEFIDWINYNTPPPVLEDEERVKIKYWVSRLRIRPEPNFNKKEIGWMIQNQIEKIIPSQTTGDWLKLKDKEGYIHKDYIDYI